MHNVDLVVYPRSVTASSMTRYCGAIAHDGSVQRSVVVDLPDGQRPSAEVVLRALGRAGLAPIGERLSLDTLDRLINEDGGVIEMLALGAALAVDRDRLAPLSFAQRIAADLDDGRPVSAFPLPAMASAACDALVAAGWDVLLTGDDIARAVLCQRVLGKRDAYRRILGRAAVPARDREHAETALALHLATLSRRNHGGASCQPAPRPIDWSPRPPCAESICQIIHHSNERK